MARRLSLEEAATRLVLVDSSILFAAYGQVDENGQRQVDDYGRRVERLLRLIARDRKLTLELVLWEFLHPGVSRDEISRRQRWFFREMELGIEAKRPSGFGQTYTNLAGMAQARGSPIDASLAACSIASKGSYVIATDDADDFCWHPGIVVITDFFRDPNACQ